GTEGCVRQGLTRAHYHGYPSRFVSMLLLLLLQQRYRLANALDARTRERSCSKYRNYPEGFTVL
ncbi:hypothetical protein NL492_26615, partial [Klebsiella pneumoniae]|nr:hypothetical protein [Klebsiella pneumoniae]